MTSEMRFNAFECIAQPNKALLDCILLLYLTYTSTVSDTLPMIQAFHGALQISTLGSCIWDPIYQGNLSKLLLHGIVHAQILRKLAKWFWGCPMQCRPFF